MNRKKWEKWVAVLSCFAVAWGSPSVAVWAAESETQEEQGMLNRAEKIASETWKNIVDYKEWFCTVIRMEMQLMWTPVMEPYLVYIASGSSRSDAETEAALLPQPAPGSTLLSGHRTKFAWNNNGRKVFRIKDVDSGVVVCEKNVANQKEISIVPKDAGMQQGHTYLWELDGDGVAIRRQMRLIDTALETEVLKQLPELNVAETYEDVDRTMLQAAYLVSLSDKSNGQVDLHWLAVEMMLQPEMDYLSDATSVKLREILLNACVDHLDKRLRQAVR